MEKPPEAAVQMLRRVMQAGQILAKSAKSQQTNAERSAHTPQPTAAPTDTIAQATKVAGSEQ
ncbi:MAG: hypothetical protein ACYDBJ_15200 [Aggregatilineales bacterium]